MFCKESARPTMVSESPEMANPTRFDFHVVDFMNSEDVERMSSDEVGQYVLLLCKSWLIGKDTTLPDDPEYLAKQARCRKVSSLVMKKFPLVETAEGPRRRNEILFGEWLLAKDRQNSASERGRKGNETRYSENNSDNNREEVATEQAVPRSSPIPFHSNPLRSVPTQSSNLNLVGGSFGQGNYKTISARWWSCFRKQLQKSKQNREQYATACSQYNEDVLLEYLEVWAKENTWVSAHPKGGNRLYVFLQALPEMIEGDSLRVAREQEEKKKQEPEVPEEKVIAAMACSQSERTNEVSEQLEKIRKQREFDEAHKDEI